MRSVSATRIFARPLEGARQLLVYSASLAVTEDLAMVLPIPVAPGTGEEAVRFIDLSGSPTFFADLAALYPVPPPTRLGGFLARQWSAPRAKLAVRGVGEFEASYVPTARDFDRLDERFRLDPKVLAALPDYERWGFAVFKLRRRREHDALTVHPMAFEFPRRDPDEIFFPTLHVHDGEVHRIATFDHVLYCQTEPAWAPLVDWEPSEEPAATLATRTRLWFASDRCVYRRQYVGALVNRDITLSDGALRARHAFGTSFRLRIRSVWQDVAPSSDARVAQWQRVTEEERMRIRDAVAAELEQVFAREGAGWGLAPFDHRLPQSHPSLYAGREERAVPSIMSGCLVELSASNDSIEPQVLSVAFRPPPTSQTCAAVGRAFQTALDRAVAPHDHGR